VAVETMVTTGLVHVAGEVTTEAYVEIPKIVRDTGARDRLRLLDKGFDGARAGWSVSIGSRAPTSPRASTPPSRAAPVPSTRWTSRAPATRA
jgi:S-adenosylmethionine synthetase